MVLAFPEAVFAPGDFDLMPAFAARLFDIALVTLVFFVFG